jgi:ABC-type phosphate/phosphonate transport system substrate-binding protein
VVAERVRGFPPEEIIRVIAESNPTPASPVVVRRDLHPSRGTALGLALAEALKGHFGSLEDPPLKWEEEARDHMYDQLRASVERLDEMRSQP